jgi:hypothetical protein
MKTCPDCRWMIYRDHRSHYACRKDCWLNHLGDPKMLVVTAYEQKGGTPKPRDIFAMAERCTDFMSMNDNGKGLDT